MKFENLDRFVEWLDSINKKPYSLKAVLDDVERQYCTSGSQTYEEAPFFTKSGNPETYSFDVLETYNEEYDSWDTTIIF